MAKLPVVTAGEAIKAFAKAGFEEVRQRGSHRVLVKPGHRYHLSIPDYGSQPLKRGLLRSQIQTAGLTVEEFVELLGD